MATYMYKSTTSKNWDDDDDDFDSTIYAGADAEFGPADTAKSSLSSARLALEELEKQSAAEYKQAQEYTQSAVTTSPPSKVDYKSIDKEYWPCAAGYATHYWHSSRPPAYPALSNDSEYIEDREYEHLELSIQLPRAHTPRLSSENESGSERDEACIPPDTSSMAKVGKCDVEVEHDPTTGAIDLTAQSIKSMGNEMARDFANFSSIAEDLTADQSLGHAGQRLLNAEINEDALRLLASNIKARSALKLITSTAEATFAVSSPAIEAVEIAPATCKQRGDGKNDSSIAPADSNALTQMCAPAIRKASPDMKHIVDPTNTSLVWNTVAAGWSALSSLPWSRIAVAAADALVDVTVFIARH
ncbi:hypothetical protein E8E11_008410 [Didymella keratinophila]|nr:hypothetical protein E8E11_008410 [Didymella keratinophila]